VIFASFVVFVDHDAEKLAEDAFFAVSPAFPASAAGISVHISSYK
jgi:hypothetical protein